MNHLYCEIIEIHNLWLLKLQNNEHLHLVLLFISRSRSVFRVFVTIYSPLTHEKENWKVKPYPLLFSVVLFYRAYL